MEKHDIQVLDNLSETFDNVEVMESFAKLDSLNKMVRLLQFKLSYLMERCKDESLHLVKLLGLENANEKK